MMYDIQHTVQLIKIIITVPNTTISDLVLYYGGIVGIRHSNIIIMFSSFALDEISSECCYVYLETQNQDASLLHKLVYHHRTTGITRATVTVINCKPFE